MLYRAATWPSGATVGPPPGFGLVDPQISPLVDVPYGPVVTIDASLGNLFLVTVTDGNPFTLANPTNPPPIGQSQLINIYMRVLFANAALITFGSQWRTFRATNIAAFAVNTQGEFMICTWTGTTWADMYNNAPT